MLPRFSHFLANLYDPHSSYFSPRLFEDFSIQMRLSLVGSAPCWASRTITCVVKEIIPGGPADLGKQLQPNDKIVTVSSGDGEPIDIIGMKLRKVVDLIRARKAPG